MTNLNAQYTVKEHGDWLEKQSADFILTNILAYQQIWQIFIGHKGDGTLAEMNNIGTEDENTRINFSQHHYTILESLYLMQLIVDDESKTRQVHSFDDYRKVLNQIMAYQAYSGRLRDNIEKCFSLLASDKEAKKSCDKLDEFYHQRHVFIHGRKVPFSIDNENLFKIAAIKRNTSSPAGFGLEMSWESISDKEMVYMEDAFKKSIEELKPLVNSLLSHLFSFVKEFIKSKKISLIPPNHIEYLQAPVSASQASSIAITSINVNVSGRTMI